MRNGAYFWNSGMLELHCFQSSTELDFLGNCSFKTTLMPRKEDNNTISQMNTCIIMDVGKASENGELINI